MEKTYQRAFLQQTNTLNAGFKSWGKVANRQLKRWALPIPIKLNECSIAIEAVKVIEKKLGKQIFDVLSIANVSDAKVTRGLIVSVGTAVGDPAEKPENWKGNVSDFPNSGKYPSTILKSNGELNGCLYINLGSQDAVADVDVAIHELGHAMGMGAHFIGFGCEDYCISEYFYTILRLIYENEIGASIGEIKFLDT